MYNAYPATLLPVKETFVSDSGYPLIPQEDTPPIVSLFNNDQKIVFKTFAAQTTSASEWAAVLSVPSVLVSDPILYPILWRFVTDDNNTFYVKDSVLISPSEKRDSESVVLTSDKTFSAKLTFPASEDLLVYLYHNNELVHTWDNTGFTLNSALPYTRYVTLNLEDIELNPSLTPYLLIFQTSSNRFTQRMFLVTPSVIKTSMDLEDYINKARVSNVIPELAYTSSDLLHYLERGLHLFNSYPPQATGFTGMSMTGSLLDCWLICSTYYILSAQLQAENALAFDFSGQSVSLNVDRTQGIESALSRMESMIDSTVKPFKKLLVKSGVSGGDGNLQGALSFGKAFGKTVLTNNPASRVFNTGSRFLNAYPWRRGVF